MKQPTKPDVTEIAPTPAEYQQMQREARVRQVLQFVFFLIGCGAVGFLLTLGHVLALKVLL